MIFHKFTNIDTNQFYCDIDIGYSINFYSDTNLIKSENKGFGSSAKYQNCELRNSKTKICKNSRNEKCIKGSELVNIVNADTYPLFKNWNKIEIVRSYVSFESGENIYLDCDISKNK